MLIIFERLPYNFKLSPSLYNKRFIQTIKESPSKAVLFLPLIVIARVSLLRYLLKIKNEWQTLYKDKNKEILYLKN